MCRLYIKLFVFVLGFAFATGFVAAQNSDSKTDRVPFDHSETGFDLEGAHSVIACASCHVGGQFAGTPRNCSVCHSLNGSVNAQSKPPNHVSTTDACDTCHRETLWDDIPRVDHTQVMGSCENCHNNSSADGKPPGHIETNAQCDACHSDIGWTPARFDHANIVENCVSCHNGITATGKNPPHILSTDNCEFCHSNIAWQPATVDHDNVMGSCSTCHNGSIATGKDNGHITTNTECNVCHSIVAWTPATFDHATIIDNCSSCHNGITATGTDNGHFITPQECNYCHTVNAWTPSTFMHTSPNYPGEHRRNLACTDCHGGNAEQVSWSFPAYMPDCAGCHANDFKADSHKKVDSPTIRYTVSELRDCTGACHEYTDVTLTTIRRSRTGEHRVGQNEF